MQTFTEATEAFLEAAYWLTDADKPAITSLLRLADELDTNGVSAALVNVYTVTHRSLMKRANNSDVVSEAEEFLNSL